MGEIASLKVGYLLSSLQRRVVYSVADQSLSENFGSVWRVAASLAEGDVAFLEDGSHLEAFFLKESRRLRRKVVLISPPVPGSQQSGLFGGMDIKIVEDAPPVVEDAPPARSVRATDLMQPTDIVLIAHEWNADGPTDWAACPHMSAWDFVTNDEGLYDEKWKSSLKHRGWIEKWGTCKMKIYKNLTPHHAMIAVMACKNFYRIDCSLILEAFGLADEKLSPEAKEFLQERLSQFQRGLHKDIRQLRDLAERKAEHEGEVKKRVEKPKRLDGKELEGSIAEAFGNCILHLTPSEVPRQAEEAGGSDSNEKLGEVGDGTDAGQVPMVVDGTLGSFSIEEELFPAGDVTDLDSFWQV
eukprot:scaffold2829_cov182-Pinguiococcus_pyrenoidosus.AAC.3